MSKGIVRWPQAWSAFRWERMRGSAMWLSFGVALLGVLVGAGLAAAAVDVTPELVFSGVQNTTSAARRAVISNNETTALRIDRITIAGTNAQDFAVQNAPALPLTIAPGDSATIEVAFRPRPNLIGSLAARLQLFGSGDALIAEVGLYGLSTRGEYGENEPPFQRVANTLGLGIDVRGTGLVLGTGTAPIGDEVKVPLFRKANTGAVAIRPVARYSPAELLPYGYYTVSGATVTEVEINTIARDEDQTLNPATLTATTSFDPGAATFGIYVDSRTFNRVTYTEDHRNTGSNRTVHAARVYPRKDRSGQAVANSYVVAFEDATNGDYQDYVFVIDNVRPATQATPTPTATTGPTATSSPTPVPANSTPTRTATPTNAPIAIRTATPTRTPLATIEALLPRMWVPFVCGSTCASE